MKKHYSADFSDYPSIGGLIISKDVMESKNPPRFMYREKPIDPQDSGWRVFSGTESDEFIQDPNNSGVYSATTLLHIDDSVADLLLKGIGAVFERTSESSEWYKVDDFDLEDDYLTTQQLTKDWSFEINNLFESSIEEDGTLYLTTGDKSVRMIIWNDPNTSDAELFDSYKEMVKNRTDVDAPTLENFECSDDKIFRIGYRIKENDDYKNYNVIYGFSIVENQIVQAAFYYDKEVDKNWAIETWKSLRFR